MHDEVPFLEAIRDKPHSIAERLSYADWLTDHGDPRGEFIHLQCLARKLSHFNPRRQALEARWNELLFHQEEQWLGPLLGQIGNWEWRYGLLDWITVDAAVFLANAERWLPALPLLGLHLRHIANHVSSLAECPQLAHVTGLYLGDNRLNDEQFETLFRSRYLGRVRTLYLHNNSLTDKSAQLLAKTKALPRVRTLGLSMCSLSGKGVLALGRAKGLRRLRDLSLMMTRFDDTTPQKLFATPLLGRLRRLNLSSNVLRPGPLAALASSPGLAHLRTLHYAMNHPGDADVTAFAQSPHVADLRVLSLGSFHAFGDAGLRAFASAPNLGRLRALDLGCGAWTPAGVRVLCRSRALKSLRALSLTQGGANTQAVARAVFGGPLIRRQRELHLETNNVGPGAIKALGSHPRPLPLWRLELPMGKDTGEAWEAVLAKGTLNGVTDLKLVDVPQGAVRAMCVPGRFPELSRLRLYGIPSDIDELQMLLDSPLWRRLTSFHLRVNDDKDAFGNEVMRRVTRSWDSPMLTTLGLLWILTAKQVEMMTACPPPPRLMTLELGSFRMGVAGAEALAGWPALRQLRQLYLQNASYHSVPGLGALARSPHAGNLMRIDIRNGTIPEEDVPELRKRFGMRVAVGGRTWPRTLVMGDIGRFTSDGLD